MRPSRYSGYFPRTRNDATASSATYLTMWMAVREVSQCAPCCCGSPFSEACSATPVRAAFVERQVASLAFGRANGQEESNIAQVEAVAGGCRVEGQYDSVAKLWRGAVHKHINHMLSCVPAKGQARQQLVGCCCVLCLHILLVGRLVGWLFVCQLLFVM